MASPSTPCASQRLMALAHELIEEARSHDCVLRLTGSLAVRQRCGVAEVLDVLEREPPADIDLFAYWKDVDAIERQLSARDWVPDPAMAQGREFGVQRLIFHTREERAKVEVFFDELKMSHTIDLRGRLEREHLTIGLAELLLSKLQIHELTSKDSKDVIAILATHDLAADGADPDQIDEARVVDALSSDWGLWYTSLANLDAIEAALADVPRLAPEHVTRVREALDRLRRAAQASPKPLKWRMRAKIGPRTRWYTEVDEVDRGAD